MISDNINRKAVTDVYKNARIALQCLSNLLPEVKDEELKQELYDQQDGYSVLLDDVREYMKKNDIPTDEIGTLQKAMMKGAVKFKTMIDASRNHVAEMMIKGTVTGITELAAMKNENQNYNEEIADFITRLLHLEEEYERRLRKFL